jgi:uncharacterized protein DUF2393
MADGLIDSSSLSDERDWRPVIIGVVVVVIVVGAIAFLLRSRPTVAPAPDPYAANLKVSDLKMSQAENFVGASVTYIDGTISNSGTKTVTHATVHVTFKNSLDQIVQTEDLPIQVLQTSGPYPDTVDLKAAPLSPGQSVTFRLTFEHVSDDWNHVYPDVKIMDVATK